MTSPVTADFQRVDRRPSREQQQLTAFHVRIPSREANERVLSGKSDQMTTRHDHEISLHQSMEPVVRIETK
jgi:hypothetical protein